MLNSLHIRILAVMVGLAVIPQLVVALFVGQRSSAALEQQALVLQQRVVSAVSSDVAAYIEEHENELQLLDQVSGLGTLPTETQETALKNLLHSQRVFQELILVDQAGQEQVHLSRTEVILDSELALRSADPAFRGPIELGETYFGSVLFDEALREPLMTISVPLFDRRQGIVVAVLIANLRFKPVWDLLAGIEFPSEGDAYVLNQRGQVVAHRNPDVVLRGRSINLSGGEGRGVGLLASDVFFASQTLAFGEQALLIVAEQPASSALALVDANNQVYLITVVLSVAVAITLAIHAAGRIVRPVEQLATAARAMEFGDFSIDVEPQGKNEIGDLARSFAAMKDRVQYLIASLQQEIGERRQAEEALRLAHERLQELDRMKSKFINDISHELRTPITNVTLYLELISRGRSENQEKYTAILNEESNRLITLCDGILDFSNLQGSLNGAEFGPINIDTLVAEVIGEHEQGAIARGLMLSFTPGAEALQVNGDAAQLRQAVANLLRNAIQYTPAGMVDISTQQIGDDDQIRLSVADTGIGMDDEEMAYCFERFYRGKRVGQFHLAPGAGLGLATVKTIVEAHQGRVEVESEIDRGTTFTIYLPQYEPLAIGESE